MSCLWRFLAGGTLFLLLQPLLAQTPSAPAIDPAWESERMSEAATAQWNRLAEAVKDGSWAQGLPSIFAAKHDVGELQPTKLEAVSQDRLFTIQRGDCQTTAKAADAQFRPLLQPFTKLDRAKFKLYSIEPTPVPTTLQYVNFAGPSGDAHLEINATWRAEWDFSVTPPLVTKLTSLAHEETRLARPKPLFHDATVPVLGQTKAWREQIRHGTTYWQQRVELFNRIFKFGHQGLAIGDANGDGREDVYLCQQGGLPNRLFLRQADGAVTDASAAAGVDWLDLTRSALFVDLDNDGDQDLVLAADTGLLALRNDGKGRFEPKIRYPQVRNAFGLSAVDYDNDGDLDLYVCRYYADEKEGAEFAVPVPYFNANNGGGNFLIRNDGPDPANWLKFADATAESGLAGQNNRRFSFAAVWDDLNDDGWMDLFVANDFGLKNLYLNERGKFRDVALEAGVDDGGFGMSAASGDYDNDGVADLYAGNMFSAAGSRVTRQPRFRPGMDDETVRRFQRMARGNSLFRGLGGARYADLSESAGVTVGRWSWASLFADLNNDGWEDLFVANGFVTGKVPDDL